MTQQYRLNLGAKEFEKIVINPAERLASGWIPFRCGGFLLSGEPVTQLRMRRAHVLSDMGAPMSPLATICREAVYAGIRLPHWGHFLLESLSRVWYLAGVDPAIPIIWHDIDRRETFWPWQSQIIDILGLGHREHCVIVEPTLVHKLIIPEPGYTLMRSVEQEQIAAMGRLNFGEPRKDRRVWLSRAKLKIRTIAEETIIEEKLSNEGWNIISPERLSVSEQIDAISKSSVIAGFEGSAFHTLLLFNKVPAKIRMIARQKEVTADFKLIATAKSLDLSILSEQLERTGAGSAELMYRGANIDAIINFINNT